MVRRRAQRAPEPEITVEIGDLGHDGRGVARVDGKAMFVTDALPGETVRARRTQRHRHFDEAELVAVEIASPERVTPPCPHFGVCGGCVLQHLSTDGQIASKQNVLQENLARIGKLEPTAWLPALRGDEWGYRRRGRLSARYVDKKQRLLLGFRERNGKYVADLQTCLVAVPAIGMHLRVLAEALGELSIARQVPQVEFASGDTGSAIVIRHLQALSDPDRARLSRFGLETGIVVLLQPSGPDSVVTLDGTRPNLEFTVDGGNVRLAFEPLDFVQVNASINEGMIAHALALLDPQPHERALDLFCGLGNFTLPLARRCAQVVGVEGDRKLVARARANAVRNNIENASFEIADLFAAPGQAHWACNDFDLMLLDPPRAGAQEVLSLLPGKRVRRVVYVSCHPASLARDAAILCERHGFRLSSAGVMDMFPHTAHVESIAVFDRN